MIYSFGIPNSAFPTGSSLMKDSLGGKGANLAEMASLDLPVPPGFTIPCDISVKYLEAKSDPIMFEAFRTEVFNALSDGMDELFGFFGYTPLVSVRSGARVSMPGMMDTILNVGLCKTTLPQWSAKLGERAALDSYRRLIQMYSSVVLGVPLSVFEGCLAAAKKSAGVVTDADLPVAALEALIKSFLLLSPDFPQDPKQQLLGAVFAVFDSWNTDRAKEYRKIYNIPASWGTAANVQAMVFGNMNDASGTGVLFTRCPSTGSYGVVGEYLVNAQGEDVVAGIRTPEPLHSMAAWNSVAHKRLMDIVVTLEHHYRDMQDVEFTVQDGSLFILQTRAGKRSPVAAFEIASSMLAGGLITKDEVLTRLSNALLLSMTVNSIAPSFKTSPHLVGVAAGGSVVSGKAVFTTNDAINCEEPCILIRAETDPDDIAGMNAAIGILTATGGLTSHAAVVARGMNKTCVVGATDLVVQNDSIAAITKDGEFLMNITPGQQVTLDGASGRVWVGVDVPVLKGGLTPGALDVLAALAGVLRLPIEDVSVQSLETLFAGVSDGVVTELDAASFDNSSITNLAVVLSKLKLSVVLNMTPPLVFSDKADHLSLFQFGEHNPNSLWLESMAWTMNAFPADVKKLIVLRGSGVGLSQFKSAGFSVLGEAKTIADLMQPSAVGSVSSAMMTDVFGSKEAYEFVVQCLKDGGYMGQGSAPSAGKYWFEVLN